MIITTPPPTRRGGGATGGVVVMLLLYSASIPKETPFPPPPLFSTKGEFSRHYQQQLILWDATGLLITGARQQGARFAASFEQTTLSQVPMAGAVTGTTPF